MNTRARLRHPGAVTGSFQGPSFLQREDVASRVAAFAAWSARICVVLVDRDLRLVEWSPGFSRMMEAGGDLAGRALAEFLHARDGGAPGFALTRQGELPLPNLLHSRRAGCAFACCVYALDDGFLVVGEPQAVSDLDLVDKISELTERVALLVADVRRKNVALRDANERATVLMHSDPLTALPNRRYVELRLDEAISHAHRHGHALALALADLDHFKRVNDEHGHAAGDQVLCAFADVLRELTRREDVPARYGGEEFVVLLPGTDAAHGANFAERLRKATAQMRPLAEVEVLTVSVGVAELRRGDTAQDLLKRADAALYEAKADGRDRVVVIGRAEEPPGGVGLLI